MKKVVDWFRRNLDNPQVVYLLLAVAACLVVVLVFGKFLAPLFTAVVIAYLLEGPVKKLVQWLRVPRLGAVLIVYSMFILVFIIGLLILLPFLFQEVSSVRDSAAEWPAEIQKSIEDLPQSYPKYADTLSNVVEVVQSDYLTEKAQTFIGNLIASSGEQVPALFRRLVTGLVYTVLVPILIFFLMKDKVRILEWLRRFLPGEQDQRLAKQVWRDVDRQTANYIRGKFLEIIIVWAASYLVFWYIDLEYRLVLSLFTGLSVLLPYIGATLMTFPILIVAIVHYETAGQVGWAMLAYGIIQLIDGNVLAPLLFSNVTNLHPVAIIAAILVFGGIWGFWGVFFAIPLATVVNAIISAWPRKEDIERIRAGGPPLPPAPPASPLATAGPGAPEAGSASSAGGAILSRSSP